MSGLTWTISSDDPEQSLVEAEPGLDADDHHVERVRERPYDLFLAPADAVPNVERRHDPAERGEPHARNGAEQVSAPQDRQKHHAQSPETGEQHEPRAPVERNGVRPHVAGLREEQPHLGIVGPLLLQLFAPHLEHAAKLVVPGQPPTLRELSASP